VIKTKSLQEKTPTNNTKKNITQIIIDKTTKQTHPKYKLTNNKTNKTQTKLNKTNH